MLLAKGMRYLRSVYGQNNKWENPELKGAGWIQTEYNNKYKYR